MRIKILIHSSLLLLAFFAINAYSVDWENQGSQTVDQMIAGDETNVAGPGENPWASRAAQVGQKGKDILSQQIGGKLNTGALTPQESRNQEQTQTASTQPVVANNTPPVQAETAEVPSISGTWLFKLVDSVSRNATIILLQSANGAVYGKGVIAKGNETFTAAASGSIDGEKLNLDLVSLEKLGLYRLALTIDADSATGSYYLFSPALEAPQTGTASAMKI
jgi:hypothetical protein